MIFVLFSLINAHSKQENILSELTNQKAQKQSNKERKQAMNEKNYYSLLLI